LTETIREMLEEESSKCISCGFCESVCPTLPDSGYQLSRGARGRVILGRTIAETDIKSAPLKSFYDSFYSCLDCFACLQVCPAGVNAGKVSQLSRELIIENTVPSERDPVAEMIVNVTEATMNPLGQGKAMASWSRGLDFEKDSPYLLYTGNMYQLMSYTGPLNSMRSMMGHGLSGAMARLIASRPSLSSIMGLQNDRKIAERMNGILRIIYNLLRKSGISVWYLGTSEPYPGTFISDLGYTEKFRKYAERVYDILKKTGKKIIVIDPHTYDLMVNIYPRIIPGFDLEIIYYLDLIKDISLNKNSMKVAFHEPCHLVLRNPQKNTPKEIIEKNFIMRLSKRSGKKTMCCGGPTELLFPDLTKKVSDRRFKDLQSLGADRIVTACPICFVNLNKSSNVIEISELIASNLA